MPRRGHRRLHTVIWLPWDSTFFLWSRALKWSLCCAACFPLFYCHHGRVPASTHRLSFASNVKLHEPACQFHTRLALRLLMPRANAQMVGSFLLTVSLSVSRSGGLSRRCGCSFISWIWLSMTSMLARGILRKKASPKALPFLPWMSCMGGHNLPAKASRGIRSIRSRHPTMPLLPQPTASLVSAGITRCQEMLVVGGKP